MSNISYWIQYLTISGILDLQEDVYKKVKKSYYEAGRHVVGFLYLFTDVSLEVQNRNMVEYYIQ